MTTDIQWQPYPCRVTLDDLTTIEFATGLPTYTDSAKAHLHAARNHPTVLAIHKQLEDGHLTEAQIQSFVQTLAKGIEPDTSFFGQYALIGLCAVMETRKTTMAKEFLQHLCDFRGNQMSTAPRVAKEALREWTP